MIHIDCKYDYGDTLYVKNDIEQLPRLLVGVIGRSGNIMLELSYCGDVAEFYEFEVSKRKNKLMIMGVNKESDDE